MRNLTLIFLTVNVLFSSSCGEDEPEPKITTSEIDGKWSLVQYNFGTSTTWYDKSAITWNIHDLKLKVIYNLVAGDRYPLIVPGNHYITIINDHFLFIGEEKLLYQFHDNRNTLRLGRDVQSDGPELLLERRLE